MRSVNKQPAGANSALILPPSLHQSSILWVFKQLGFEHGPGKFSLERQTDLIQTIHGKITR